MTDTELRTLAIYIVNEQAKNKEWMRAFFDAKRRNTCIETHIHLKEAAALIGRSQSWLKKHKEEFEYTKNGKARSSPILFDESTLIEDYHNYMERTRLKHQGRKVK